jgi:hypothetical protein
MVEIGEGEGSRDDKRIGLVVLETGSPDSQCLRDRACSDESEDIFGVRVASVDTPSPLGNRRNFGSSSLINPQLQKREIWTAASVTRTSCPNVKRACYMSFPSKAQGYGFIMTLEGRSVR